MISFAVREKPSGDGFEEIYGKVESIVWKASHLSDL